MSLATRRPVSRAASFTRGLVSVYRKRDVPFMAGSIAYAAFISLIPLVALLVVAASVLGGEALRQTVIDLTAQYLTSASQGIVKQSLEQAQESVELSLVGLVALLWTVLKVFRSLDTAFSTLYDSETNDGLVDRVRDGVVVLGAMSLAVLTMVGVGTLVALAPTVTTGVETELPLVRIVGLAVLVVGLTVAFLPMYYVFPDVEMTVERALPGAVVAALGWTLLQALFQVYVSVTSAGELYGVVGGVVLFITWLYFGAVVVLLGAATNVVLSGRHRAPGYGETA